MAVAVFTGYRAPIAHDQIGGFLQKTSELSPSVGGFEIEGHALMDDTFAKVTVIPSLVSELRQQRLVVAQIWTEHPRMNGCVLPSFVRDGRQPGNDRRAAIARLTHFPNPFHFVGITHDLDVGRIGET